MKHKLQVDSLIKFFKTGPSFEAWYGIRTHNVGQDGLRLPAILLHHGVGEDGGT